MALSRNTVLVVVALTTWIMVSDIPQGEAQFTTPLSCLKTINNNAGCKNAFTQTVLHNNASSLTPECCKLVNGISKICALLLFPFHPEALTVLKSLCTLVYSPSPPSGAANPPPPTSSASSPPSNAANPPPSTPSPVVATPPASAPPSN